MEMKLTVLAGAKHGTSIPLKKDEFTIGRSSECTLRAGSEAISRRHCLIQRTAEGFAVSDLGSRNGTFLNGEQVKSPTLLQMGDELRIGPLTFRIDPAEKKPGKPTHPAEPAAEPSPGLRSAKQPRVKDVADVAARVSSGGEPDAMEDDISRWLIGADQPLQATNETVNFKIDETKALKKVDVSGRGEVPDAAEQAASSTAEDVIDQTHGNEDEDKESGSGWSLFGRGKKGKEPASRPKPGKLPQRPDKDQAKDSREAAANVLREMTRRR